MLTLSGHWNQGRNLACKESRWLEWWNRMDLVQAFSTPFLTINSSTHAHHSHFSTALYLIVYFIFSLIFIFFLLFVGLVWPRKSSTRCFYCLFLWYIYLGVGASEIIKFMASWNNLLLMYKANSCFERHLYTHISIYRHITSILRCAIGARSACFSWYLDSICIFIYLTSLLYSIYYST